MMNAAHSQPQAIPLRDIVGEFAAAHTQLAVTGIALDSRQVKPGNLFFAYPGERSDGRHYIAQAVASGASVIAIEPGGDALAAAVPLLTIKNLRENVGIFAANFYAHPSQALDLVGITGTNGKTTTSQLLAQLLGGLRGQCGAIGTLGIARFGVGFDDIEQQSGLTTPDPIALQKILASWRDQNIPAAVMEVSSHALDQGRCNGLQYRAAVFTNLSRDHLDYHGDMASYAAAKAKLFSWKNLEFAFINLDDPFGEKLLSTLPSSVKAYGYSICHSNAALYAQVVDYRADGMQIVVTTPWGNLQATIGLIGEFNLSNVLAAIGCAAALGHDIQDVAQFLPALKPVAGRMEMLTAFPVKGIVDYAHTPDALEKTLQAIRRHCAGKILCVFGCGGDRDKGKRPQMGDIAARLAGQVVITSDNPRSENPQAIIADIVAGIADQDCVHIETDRAAAIRYAVQQAQPGDIILVAGKGHEDYQLIAGERLPFSDRAHLQAALAGRFGETYSGVAQ